MDERAENGPAGYRPAKDGARQGPAPGPRRLWLRRLGWMLGLWAGGVAALWVVASLIRTIMHAAGMR